MNKTISTMAVAMVATMGSMMAAAPQAHAIVETRQVAECKVSFVDAGADVKISETIAGLFPNPEHNYAAEVTGTTLHGPISSSLDVRFQQGAAVGASQFYTGENFELQIVVDAAPNAQGMLGYLTINRDGFEFKKQEVRCKLNN